jgi:protein-S-isoprenylcysteine O-methyltransferase Ste14
MDPSAADGAAVRFPPPLVYLLAVVAGAAGHAFLLPLPLGLGAGARIAATLLALGLGVAAIAGAIGLFRRTGQDPKPWTSTPELITTGVYRWSRNPMYVGLALIQIGIAIGLANAWILALVPPVLAVVYATAIRHEERYLEREFGETYLEYKRSVRRWL